MQKSSARKGLGICLMILAILSFETGYSIVGAFLMMLLAIGALVD